MKLNFLLTPAVCLLRRTAHARITEKGAALLLSSHVLFSVCLCICATLPSAFTLHTLKKREEVKVLTHNTVHYTRTHVTRNCALRVDLASFSESRSCFHNNTSFSIYCLSPSSFFFPFVSFPFVGSHTTPFCVYTFCGSWTFFFLVVGKRTPPVHTHGTLTTSAPFFPPLLSCLYLGSCVC